jgi:Rrf2 family protein
MIGSGPVPSRTVYAIRALIGLADATPNGLRGTDLAHAHQIPSKYVYEVLAALRRGRLVLSRRGPSGGFHLARPPAEITLADVARAMGAVPSLNALTPSGRARPVDPLLVRLQTLWAAADTATMRILESVSVADLIDPA